MWGTYARPHEHMHSWRLLAAVRFYSPCRVQGLGLGGVGARAAVQRIYAVHFCDRWGRRDPRGYGVDTATGPRGRIWEKNAGFSLGGVVAEARRLPKLRKQTEGN